MALIFVVDAITAQPGKAGAVLDAYMRDYAPAARERGMTLEQKLITPPIVLKGSGMNRLTFIWSLPSLDGWWRMRFTAAFDPRITAFWTALKPLIANRERHAHEEVADHV